MQGLCENRCELETSGVREILGFMKKKTRFSWSSCRHSTHCRVIGKSDLQFSWISHIWRSHMFSMIPEDIQCVWKQSLRD